MKKIALILSILILPAIARAGNYYNIPQASTGTTGVGKIQGSMVGEMAYQDSSSTHKDVTVIGSSNGVVVNPGTTSEVRLSTTGTVVIGTAPASALSKVHIQDLAGSSASDLLVATGTTKIFEVSGTSVALKVPLIFLDGSVQTTASGASQWAANGSDVYNTAGGRVGVGTSSPLEKLHIFQAAGTAGPQAVISTGTTKLLEVSGASVSVAVPLYLNGPLIYPDGTSVATATPTWTPSGSNAYFSLSGNVGIGTISPGSMFNVYGGSVSVHGAGKGLQVGSTDFLVSNGKTGIGTTIPRVELEVQAPAGTSGPNFIVSTGTTKILEVSGSSVSLGQPLYFPDGTSMASAQFLSEIIISSFTNYGSGKTKIVFMSSSTANGPYISSGTDIVWNIGDSVNGSSFTLVTGGVYSITYSLTSNVNQQDGLTVNELSTDGTANFQVMTGIGSRFCGSLGVQTGSDAAGSNSCTRRFYAGDVIRLHSQGDSFGGSTRALDYFSIRKVGN